MFLTVTAGRPNADTSAREVGLLLHKHPDRVQQFEVSSGTAHVLYPQADDEVTTLALLVDVDPIRLVRAARGRDLAASHYVNDRPYAASSHLAVTIGKVLRTAMAGRCDQRPDLVEVSWPLTVRLPALPCNGGIGILRRVFEPLGWQVGATSVPLDPMLPQWGESPYLDAELHARLRVADALTHLYVLLPVLDDSKHYWVTQDEVDKLLRAGERWLAGHPDRELIIARYLTHRRALTDRARERLDQATEAAGLERLAAVDDAAVTDLDNALDEPRPEAVRVSLAEQRRAAVVAAVSASAARTVADLGCGAGALLPGLLGLPALEQIIAADVSVHALNTARRRLRFDRMPGYQRSRLQFIQTSLMYRDDRLVGLEAAVLMEVVEHVDPWRLPALERVVFGEIRPGTVVVSTPNVEYNVRYPGLADGRLRHRDHRFEWTRAQFGQWTGAVCDEYGYTVTISGVGDDDAEVGSPTQLAVFTDARQASASEGTVTR